MISNLTRRSPAVSGASALAISGHLRPVALAFGILCLCLSLGDAKAQPGPPAGSSEQATPAQPALRPGAAPPVQAPPDARTPRPLATIGTLPQNLSPWGMFTNADIIVQVVMVGLALASVLTWTVWLAKSIELFSVRRASRRLLDRIRAAPSLGEAETAVQGSRNPVAGLLAAAVSESDRSAGLDPGGVKERAALRLERLEAASARRMTRGTGLLATIGATAPFVGLFGTVWGIMNAFVGISKAQTTNLAVVAPGIAEALLATAIGLVAAIPAVVIFNVFARSIAGYRLILGDASAEIVAHLSRDLDRAGRPMLRAAE